MISSATVFVKEVSPCTAMVLPASSLDLRDVRRRRQRPCLAVVLRQELDVRVLCMGINRHGRGSAGKLRISLEDRLDAEGVFGHELVLDLEAALGERVERKLGDEVIDADTVGGIDHPNRLSGHRVDARLRLDGSSSRIRFLGRL